MRDKSLTLLRPQRIDEFGQVWVTRPEEEWYAKRAEHKTNTDPVGFVHYFPSARTAVCHYDDGSPSRWPERNFYGDESFVWELLPGKPDIVQAWENWHFYELDEKGILKWA